MERLAKLRTKLVTGGPTGLMTQAALHSLSNSVERLAELGSFCLYVGLLFWCALTLFFAGIPAQAPWLLLRTDLIRAQCAQAIAVGD
jgi:hypothetical protein